MIDDIDLNKAAIIRRCLKRISEEYSDEEHCSSCFVPTGDEGVLPRLLELVHGFDKAGKFLSEAEFVIVSGCGLNPFVNEGQR